MYRTITQYYGSLSISYEFTRGH